MSTDLSFFPPSASTFSDKVDALYMFLVAVSAFFTILITLLVIVFSVRYRRRVGGEGATQIHGSLALEVFWTAIPLALCMVMFVWATRLFFEITRTPAGCRQYYVTAKQWMWKLQHPTGQREINALHVPVGVSIELKMISEDVIHSFYVPAFRIKRDVLPGRYSTVWFQATKPGQYHLFCAEYCGTEHSRMGGTIYVMEPADYERWLSGAVAGESPRDLGEKLFAANRCDTCHTNLPGARGPNLIAQFGQKVKLADGSEVLFDEGYVRESILTPNAKTVAGFQSLMPTYTGQLTEDQILGLVAYIKSLKDAAQGGAKP